MAQKSTASGGARNKMTAAKSKTSATAGRKTAVAKKTRRAASNDNG